MGSTMQIPFDTSDKAAQQTMVRDTIKALRTNGATLKPADPKLPPPVTPQLNPNPRKHDVVAWRRDGLRLDTTKHDTKEAALEHARALPWVIYFAYAVMCGRELVQRCPITIPEGMALDDNDMPIKI